MKRITVIEKSSVWRDDRSHFIGETFKVDGQRYYPQSDKAKAFAKAQGVEYFVFVGTVITENV